MFSSLAAGMSRVATPRFFVTLGDMPWIQPAVYAALLQCPKDCDAVFPVFEGRRGHPVLFGQRMKEEALRADPATGSMREIASRMSVHEMPWDDGSIHRDIDTPRDCP